METWDAIRSRRDVRAFAERPIGDDDLDRILEAGRRSPSSRNWQPWDFVVVTDRERAGRAREGLAGRGARGELGGDGRLIAAVVERATSGRHEYFDLGQARAA